MRATCVLFAALTLTGWAHAQLKLTDPTAAELTMTADPKAPGAPAIILSYEEIDDADSAEMSVHVRIKVLTDGGLSAANVEIPDRIVRNDSFEQAFFARTILRDGTIVPFVASKAGMLTPATGEDVAKKVFALPSAQVGCILEYMYHFAGQNTVYTELRGHYAPFWHVQQPQFVKSAHFVLKTPPLMEPTSIHWVALLPSGLAPEQGKKTVTLDAHDIPAGPDEELMQPRNSALYRVRFFYRKGDLDKYWGETGDYADQDWSLLDYPTKALTTAVQGLIQPTDSDHDKLKKIYAEVMKMDNTDLTRSHSKIEDKKSGVHDVNNSGDLWLRRRGDSDDLTLLFIAMARAAGFHAFPMAVTSRRTGVFDQKVLSWEQLDDLIAIVTVAGKDEFFDPGTRMCPFGHLAPWHADVFGVSAEDKTIKIRSTPPEPFATLRVERIGDLTIAPDGKVTGKIAVRWVGNAGLTLRRNAIREGNAEVEDAVRHELSEQAPQGVDLKLISLTGLEDGEAPLVGMFSVSGTLGMSTQKRVIIPSQFFVSTAKPILSAESRTMPVNFLDAHVDRDLVTVHLPASLAVESLPAKRSLRIAKDTSYDSAAENVKAGSDAAPDRMVVMQRVFVMDRVEWPVDYYVALHKYFSQIATADSDQVVLTINSATAPN